MKVSSFVFLFLFTSLLYTVKYWANKFLLKNECKDLMEILIFIRVSSFIFSHDFP